MSILLTTSVFAQSPQGMSYQAVVRDAGQNLIANQSVGTQIRILQGSVSGGAVYVETHALNTNINGLLTLEIGSGTVVAGDFATIDWANGPYYIQTGTRHWEYQDTSKSYVGFRCALTFLGRSIDD